jgi:hypothetical protein
MTPDERLRAAEALMAEAEQLQSAMRDRRRER